MPGDRRTATVLLQAWRGGDRDALDRLLPVVYDELSGLAQRALHGERPDHTLQTRALVHEAYLRLVDADISFQDRAHFMAVAARTMRRVLVDHARARRRDKRGGDAVRVDLDTIDVPAPDSAFDLLDLHDALERLAAFDARTTAGSKRRSRCRTSRCGCCGDCSPPTIRIWQRPWSRTAGC